MMALVRAEDELVENMTGRSLVALGSDGALGGTADKACRCGSAARHPRVSFGVESKAMLRRA